MAPISLELENQHPKPVHGKIADQEEDQDRENFCYAVQLVFSSVLPMSLHAAIELGVFDIIAKAGEGAELSAAEIAVQMPTSNHDAAMMVDRILRLLASHSVLNCSVVAADDDDDDESSDSFKRLYGLGPVSKYFVTNEDGVSLGPFMALIQDKVILDCWSVLLLILLILL